jgi:hypothetical protein
MNTALDETGDKRHETGNKLTSETRLLSPVSCLDRQNV